MSNKPKILTKPFCYAGDKSLPVDSEDVKKASYPLGFPLSQSTPIKKGGEYVKRVEVNGALFPVYDHVVYMNRGGQYTFDQNWANAGGYAKDDVLWDYVGKQLVYSTKDDNKDNFLKNREFIGKSWVSIVEDVKMPVGTITFGSYDLATQRANGMVVLAGQYFPKASVSITEDQIKQLLDTSVFTKVTEDMIYIADNRGRFFRMIGGNAGNAGTCQADAIVNISGGVDIIKGANGSLNPAGAFTQGEDYGGSTPISGGSRNTVRCIFNSSNIVSAAAEVRPINTAYPFYLCVSSKPIQTTGNTKTFYCCELIGRDAKYPQFTEEKVCEEYATLDGKPTGVFNNPQYSTTEKPPMAGADEVACLIDGKWKLLKDNRNKEYYELVNGKWRKAIDIYYDLYLPNQEPKNISFIKPVEYAIEEKLNLLKVFVYKNKQQAFMYKDGDLEFKPSEFESELAIAREIASLKKVDEIVVPKISDKPIKVFEVQLQYLENQIHWDTLFDTFKSTTKIFEKLTLKEIEALDIVRIFEEFVLNKII
ncbi:hypothetical protein [Francisella tularensis]|uniref:hypothetical protein n=1 Tax=Francisella tularensis TaxID=263 RepID=UPI0008F4C606|nr:hypothetical protein [Francisella tularensis]APA83228.1 hypothetical protein N894_1244 [Francisella tularensis subsp. novicida PA10-7858]